LNDNGGRWAGRLTFGVCLAIVLTFGGIAWFAPWGIDCLAGEPEQAKACSETARNIGLSVAGGFGAIIAVIALYFNARRTHTDRLRLTNDTYVKAIEQLASPSMEVRIGGMYALERIAHEEQRYHWPVIETLSAYIRERAPWPAQEKEDAKGLEAIALSSAGKVVAERLLLEPSANTMATQIQRRASVLADTEPTTTEVPQRRVSTDIQTALTIVARRVVWQPSWAKRAVSWVARWPWRLWYLVRKPLHLRLNYRPREIDLSRVNLNHTDIWRGNLLSGNLSRSNLRNVLWGYAVLSGVPLREADLRGAILVGAHLAGADLTKANLRGAIMTDVELSGADLSEARFSKHPQELGARWDEADPPKNLDKIIIEPD